MRISKSAAYGLLAVGYVIQHKDGGIIRAQTIAEKYDIPSIYLYKIMGELVKANVLRSKRGPKGGFSLARPAGKITMLDIVEAAEGPAGASLGIAENAPGSKFARKAEAAYGKAISRSVAVLKSVKLSDLL